MLTFVKNGNMFESECEAWVNPVNCIGVMGGGLALAFKKKFPEMFKEYKKVCDNKGLMPGIMHVWENPEGKPKYIINFPTKDDLSPSQLTYVTAGLISLSSKIKALNIKSIAIPGLGCGLGGLSFTDVRKYIKLFAEVLPDVEIEVYEPLEN